MLRLLIAPDKFLQKNYDQKEDYILKNKFCQRAVQQFVCTEILKLASYSVITSADYFFCF